MPFVHKSALRKVNNTVSLASVDGQVCFCVAVALAAVRKWRSKRCVLAL